MLIRLWGATCNSTVVHGNCVLGALSQLRKRGWKLPNYVSNTTIKCMSECNFIYKSMMII